MWWRDDDLFPETKAKEGGMKRIPPIAGQLYAKVENWHDSRENMTGVETLTTDVEKGNVITSAIADKVTHHKVIIDLDLPAKLIPSSTPGHFHLYIDHELESDKYFTLLRALADAGLIEEGYFGASQSRGYTAVRLPWVKKEEQEEKVSETTISSGSGSVSLDSSDFEF